MPTGGFMNAGVYVIKSVTNPSLGNATNTTWTASGTVDTAGAVAIVLDNTDTGTLDWSSAVLNGLDDLYPVGYNGPNPRDPQGTHNFVIYGGNGATGFAGSVSVGPGATTDLSGISRPVRHLGDLPMELHRPAPRLPRDLPVPAGALGGPQIALIGRSMHDEEPPAPSK